MRKVAWLACCGLAGGAAMLFVALVAVLATFGIELHGDFAKEVVRAAVVVSLAIGFVVGLLLGGRHFRASGGRPGAGAWLIVFFTGALPTILVVMGART